MTTPLSTMEHPYYPLGVSMPQYEPNGNNPVVFLGTFGLAIFGAIWVAWRLSLFITPSLKSGEQLSIAWFALCGFLHCFFEGYFVWNHATLAGLQSVFAQAWKEYALSDSRYLTSDVFMICVESITVVVWGPLCWSIVMATATRSTLRHPLQIIMCVGHLYGVALYYSTSLTERAMVGTMHSRPEFLYFWVYYVGFNAPWVAVPSVLLVQSIGAVRRAFAALEMQEGRKKE